MDRSIKKSISERKWGGKAKYKRVIVNMAGLLVLVAFFSSCTKKEKLTALIGPLISNVAVTSSSITSASATITWVTNVRATSLVVYGKTASFGSSTTETDTGTSMTKTHSVTLTGLSASTLYYFYVESKDSNGTASDSGKDGDYTFTTSAAGPMISNISVSPSTNSATISWTTSEAATSQVGYGTTANFGSTTTENPTLTTNHAVTLTGLAANAVYYYYVKSKNAQGNSSSAGEDGSRTFVTSGGSSGTTVYLYLDDIKIEGTGGTPITIYDDDFSSGIFTGGNNDNIKYMGSPNNGCNNITGMDTFATDDKHGGSTSWKITLLKDSSFIWAGMYVTASGSWRADWVGTEKPANLTGPTGTVKLTCWAKISGANSMKIEIGIGDNNNNHTPYDSVTGGKKTIGNLSINSTSWTLLELDLTGQDLSSINGVFLWSVAASSIK